MDMSKQEKAREQEMESKKMAISFYECEHDGDLDHYCDDLAASGARVLKSRVNHDEEEGVVVIEVSDVSKFKARFAQTESFEFSSLA